MRHEQAPSACADASGSPQSDVTRATEYSVPLLTRRSVPLLGLRSGLESYLCTDEKMDEEVVQFLGGDEEESPSGSVSDVVAEEDDVVCDDGSGLTSDLVLVHILSIVQFPLH